MVLGLWVLGGCFEPRVELIDVRYQNGVVLISVLRFVNLSF